MAGAGWGILGVPECPGVHSWDLGMGGPVWSLTSVPLLTPC